ncbi:hypothetical protein [Salinimicrobium gaetbulicola]|uniref:Uncharacterized protein n=1 Tax=Salinimicrobium gaetbulicola TaxID=999702 RepID=A0ABW3IES8_9FLAO
MKDIQFFKGLSKTSSFERLCRFTLQEAVLACVFEDFENSSFVVENFQDRCLLFTSPVAHIFVLVENDPELLDGIRETLEQLRHLKTAVVQIEMDLDLTEFQNHYNLCVEDIITAGVRRGIPSKNLFFVLLKELYDDSCR